MAICGIDLGGTNLRVGCGEGSGELRLAQGEDGAHALPATVWFAGPGEAWVGAVAAAAARTHPDEVVTAVRAELLSERAGDLGSRQERYFHGKYESAEAVARRVYSYAAERAARCLGQPVRDVLIGVPVAAGRAGSRLRRAATDAGLNVVNSLAEPVAVAMHYGMVTEDSDNVVAVCDLGATTLHVSVLRIRSRGVEIVSSASTPVGGRTWDEVIAADLRAQVSGARRGRSGRSDDQADRFELLTAAEELKIALSEAPTASRLVRGAGFETEVRLDRERMEQLTADLVDRVVSSVQTAISSAGDLAVEHPRTVLLAGGAGGMPILERALTNGVRAEVRADDPEIAVVDGLVRAADFGALWVTLAADGAAPDLRAPPRPVQAMPPAGSQEPSAGVSADHDEAPEPVLPDPDPPASPVLVEEPPRREVATPPAADPGYRPGAVPASPSGQDTAFDDGREVQAAELTPCPVGQLGSIRRGRSLQVTWIWPRDSATARVQWHFDGDPPGRSHSARCSRRSYEHDGGFVMPIGLGGATITVEALVPGEGFDVRPPSSLRVEPLAPVVTYDPDVRKGLRQWTVDVTFTSEVDCDLPPTVLVLGTGSYRPVSTRDGEILREIPASRLTPSEPLTETFQMRPRRGRCWLVCLLTDPDAATVDLQPAALHRLRVQ